MDGYKSKFIFSKNLIEKLLKKKKRKKIKFIKNWIKFKAIEELKEFFDLENNF
jgi:hypothetical protein